MLTFFTIPKAFKGHIDIIQRNAIKSWTLLQPSCEVILMGDDEGTAEAAKDLGVSHIPDINRNEFGTPLLDHAYHLAESQAKHPLLCYANADTILMSDLMEAVQKVKETTDWFFMTSQSRGLDVRAPVDYDSGWEERLLSDVAKKGRLSHFTGIDFWVYPRLLLEGMPPLAVGRIAFECWCLYKARLMNADVIDATKVVVSVHQTHDYSHHPDGELGIGRGVEAQRNRELVGGKPYFFILKDRTHILGRGGLKRARDAWWLWRSLRTAQVLPLSVPLPVRLTLKALNAAINAGRDLAVLVRSRRPWSTNR